MANTEKLDESSVWYINDELGTAISHNDHPNAKLIPFLFSEDNKMGENMVAYSLIWPLKPINEGEIVCRDYLHGFTEKKQRSSRLSIWYELPFKFYQNINLEYEKHVTNLRN